VGGRPDRRLGADATPAAFHVSESLRSSGTVVSGVPGVVALGATRDEGAERIREAVNAHADEMAALGTKLPDPVAATGTVRAA
jgi:hypothetical protein